MDLEMVFQDSVVRQESDRVTLLKRDAFSIRITIYRVRYEHYIVSKLRGKRVGS